MGRPQRKRRRAVLRKGSAGTGLVLVLVMAAAIGVGVLLYHRAVERERAAHAASEPVSAVERLLEAMRQGDVVRLRECYSVGPQHEAGIKASLQGPEAMERLRAMGREVRAVRMERTSTEAGLATLVVVLKHEHYEERIRIRVVKSGGLWRLTAATYRPLFFPNAWLHMREIAERTNAGRPSETAAARYTSTLKAIEYARTALADRPDDLNLAAIAGDLYMSRLSQGEYAQQNAARLRTETLNDGPVAEIVSSNQASHRRLVGDDGLLLPSLVAAQAGELFVELEHLAPYNTKQVGGFPLGVPPQALAYNYWRRAERLRRKTGQSHLQLSDRVIDTRPAVALGLWAAHEDEHGTTAEGEARGRGGDGAAYLRRAEFGYARAALLYEHTERELAAVLSWLGDDALVGNYRFLREEARAKRLLLAAESGRMKLASLSDTQRPAARAHVRQEYQAALDALHLIILAWFVDDEVAAACYPAREPGTRHTRQTISQVPAAEYPRLLEAVNATIARRGGAESHPEDRLEYEALIARALRGLAVLKGL